MFFGLFFEPESSVAVTTCHVQFPFWVELDEKQRNISRVVFPVFRSSENEKVTAAMHVRLSSSTQETKMP